MFLILFILDNPEKTHEILDAWEAAGVSGATILPSTGLYRIQKKAGLTGDLPLMPRLEDFLQREEDHHNTLFSVVRERAVVDRVIQATQSVVGDLNLPETGILVVLPVLEAYGLDRRSRD